MAKTRPTTKRQNRGDGGSRWRFVGAAPWSDLNHHLLYSVMMKLEVIDFPAFSGVCKSWRSLALINKNMFMASRPPMAVAISERGNKKEYCLEDFKGRMSKIRLPKSGGRTCVGVTCGYLVLFGTKPREFLLMNPITRHGLRFPKVPRGLDFDIEPDSREGVRAILVFSPSLSAWVLVVLCRYGHEIWYSIAGKGVWDYYVYSKSSILDLHDFKGKIYAIDIDSRLYELVLDPEPKLTLLKTKNLIESDLVFLEFVCSAENLYAMECFCYGEYEVHELDFGEMKWVSPEEKTMEEYTIFVSDLKHSAAIKREVWSESWSQFNKKYGCCDSDASGDGEFCNADIWYFPHVCLKVNLKH